jgi:hypothetical protein
MNSKLSKAEQLKRNADIERLSRLGSTRQRLAEMYSLSVPRIDQIVRAERARIRAAA